MCIEQCEIYSLQFNLKGGGAGRRGCKIDPLQLLWLIMLKLPCFDIQNEFNRGGELEYKITMN